MADTLTKEIDDNKLELQLTSQRDDLGSDSDDTSDSDDVERELTESLLHVLNSKLVSKELPGRTFGKFDSDSDSNTDDTDSDDSDDGKRRNLGKFDSDSNTDDTDDSDEKVGRQVYETRLLKDLQELDHVLR